MNGFLLVIPFLLIRFGLLSLLSKKAVARAAHFAPVYGAEKGAYLIYQAATAALFLVLPFLAVRTEPLFLFCGGGACYLLGLALCALSLANFSSPSPKGLNTEGLYRFSRNPMYLSYFVCFLGMALLTQSVVLLGVVLVFQVSAHWIILSEERWCVETFGDAYRQYMQRVRRYI